MSNNKESSVEWLYDKIILKLYKLQKIEYTHIFLEELEQAKAMHKDEMIEFAQEVFRNRYNQVYQSLGNIADDIYNETFNNDEQ